MTEEEWRPIPEFPTYSVSSFGRVRRDAGGRGAVPGRILKMHIGRTGYYIVQLWRNQTCHTCSVHRLVAATFIPAVDNRKMEVAHSDGNALNNHLSNLRWADRIDNMDDCRRHGTMAIGIKNGKAKLDEGKVVSIRQMSASGCSICDIAKKFNVVPQTIKFVLNRTTWKHVA